MKKLDVRNMSKIQGGVTLDEYCATAAMIIKYNDISADTMLNVGITCGWIVE